MIIWYSTLTTTDGRIIHYGYETEEGRRFEKTKEGTNEVICYEEKMDTYIRNLDVEKYYGYTSIAQ